MRDIISLGGMLVLLFALACGNGSELEKQSPRSMEPPLVTPISEATTWSLIDEETGEIGGAELTLPIRLFQGPEFLTLDSLDGNRSVTFTKSRTGRYYANIGGIVFILEMH